MEVASPGWMCCYTCLGLYESLEVCQRPVHVGAHRRRLTDPSFCEFDSYFDAKTERQIAGGILFSHRFPITTVEACVEEVHHVN